MARFLLTVMILVATKGWCGNNDTSSQQVSIMTYNVKMLPRGATWIHHHPVIRARILPAVLMKEGVDVIVLQEGFDGKAVRIMRKKLKPMYPYTMGYKNRKVISYKRAGGVLMFSKYPMREIESNKYHQCKGIDCIGNKGVMLVEVAHPAHTFQLLGTHMQAGGGRDLKISQYADAGATLKRHEVAGIPQFAAGDFNTHKVDTFLYPRLVDSLQAEDGDISSELKFTSDHLLNDMDSYNPTRRNIIDYVFYKSNGVKYQWVTREVKAYEQQWNKKHKSLSDHNAVILKMQFAR